MIIPELKSLNTGSKRGPLYIKKNFPEFYKLISKGGQKFPESLYLYYHGEPDPCPCCGGRPVFRSFSKGFTKYCSPQCANSDSSKKEAAKQTWTERYGGVGWASAEQLEKAVQTQKRRYGENYRQRQIEARKQTNLKRYGYEQGLSAPEVRDKIKRTCLERYGVDTVMRLPEHQEKCSESILKKYGVTNAMHSDEVRERLARTCLERYGVPYPFQSPEIQKKCAHHDTYIERFVENILSSHNVQYIRECETVIPPARPDFYLPDYNMVIECNGTYWHSDKCKSTSHHKSRFVKCESLGIQQVTIWQDQIDRIPDIVESVLLSKLNIYKRKIGARQCEVRTINSRICNTFLNENHIQGATSARVHYGAFYNNELVGVMTFIRGRGCQGSSAEWELNRFCTVKLTQVCGLVSKMLKVFISQYHPEQIISFSHNDISNGSVYKKLGFVTDGVINNSYYYVKGSCRYHRSTFTKASIVVRGWRETKSGWTEHEVMDEHNYYRIYDCGTKKWVLTLNHLE
jgi:hypothetical protein